HARRRRPHRPPRLPAGRPGADRRTPWAFSCPRSGLPGSLDSAVVNRRAYGLLVGTAIMMGVLALVASRSLGLPVRDPEGFLGPAWIRLPLLVLGAFLADVVPRSLWRARGRWGAFNEEARRITKEHWTRERITLVVIGLASFYVTYV